MQQRLHDHRRARAIAADGAFGQEPDASGSTPADAAKRLILALAALAGLLLIVVGTGAPALLGVSMAIALPATAFALAATASLAARAVRNIQLVETAADTGGGDRLAEVLDALPDGVAVWSAEGDLIAANARYRGVAPRIAAAIYPGRDFDDLLETEIDGGYAPAGLDHRWRELRQLQRLGDGRALRRELGGREYRCDEHVGKDGASVTVVRDVTETAARERHLKDSEERYRLALTATDQGLWDLDLRSGRFFASASLAGLVGGQDSDHFRPRQWLRAIHRDDFPNYRERWRAHMRGEAPVFSAEYRVADGSGGHRWVSDRAIALRDGTGRPYRIAGAVSDISPSKETEAALHRAREQAEQAGRAKSEFLAGVSHELRTPLNAIIGFSQMLRDDEVEPAKRAEYAGIIHDAGTSLDDVVNDLIDIARHDAGKLQLNESRFDLRDCLQRLVPTLAGKSRDNGVALSLNVPAHLPLLVGDEVKVKQMLRNLMSVAISASPAGQVVEVDVRWSPAQGMHIDIVGQGMPADPDLLGRALDPVKSPAGPPSRRMQGPGLELAVVKAFADLHGARFNIEPLPRGGCRAGIVFPPDRLA